MQGFLHFFSAMVSPITKQHGGSFFSAIIADYKTARRELTEQHGGN